MKLLRGVELQFSEGQSYTASESQRHEKWHAHCGYSFDFPVLCAPLSLSTDTGSHSSLGVALRVLHLGLLDLPPLEIPQH